MVTVVKEDFPEHLYYDALNCGQVAIDIETSGLKWQTDRIGCVTMFIPGRGVYCARNLYDAPTTLRNIINSNGIQKVFHYALFDLKFLVNTYRLQPKNITCTKIAAHLHDPAKTKFYDPNKEISSHSLAALVYTLYGERLEKSTATSNWFQDEFTEEQLNYVEKDVIYLIDILSILEESLKKSGKLQRLKQSFSYIPNQVYNELEGIKNLFSYE